MSLIIDRAGVGLDVDGASTFHAEALNVDVVLVKPSVGDNMEASHNYLPTQANKGVTGRIPQLLPVGRMFKQNPKPRPMYPVPYTEWARMIQVVRPGQLIELRATALLNSTSGASKYVRFVDKTNPAWVPLGNGAEQSTFSRPPAAITGYSPWPTITFDYIFLWKVPANISGPRVIAFETEFEPVSMPLTELLIMGA